MDGLARELDADAAGPRGVPDAAPRAAGAVETISFSLGSVLLSVG